MEVVDTKEKWTNQINTVTIGATPEQGGTRGSTVTVGGETTLPFLTDEGGIPNRPVIAGVVADVVPEGWPDILKAAIGDVINTPAEWAQKLVEECKVDMISLKLIGPDPAGAKRSAEEAANTVKAVLEAVDVPLIFWGCDDEETDNVLLLECSHAAKGEVCLIGSATESNYRTLGAIGTADKHKVIAEAPVDINIGKQVNILLPSADRQRRLGGLEGQGGPPGRGHPARLGQARDARAALGDHLCGGVSPGRGRHPDPGPPAVHCHHARDHWRAHGQLKGDRG